MSDNVSNNNNINYQQNYENTLENYQIEEEKMDVNNKIPRTLLVCRAIQNQE